MNVAPWIPPQFADLAGFDASWNALVSHAGQSLALATKGAAATFAIAEAPNPVAQCVRVEPTKGPSLYVVWTSVPFRAMFGADFNVDDLEILPAALRDALNEGMVAFVWAAIPNAGLGNFVIGGAGPLRAFLEDRDRENLAWFAVTLKGIAQEPVAFVVGCRREALLRMIAEGGLAPAQIHGSLKAKLTSEACWTLGAVAMTISELRSLGSGAVVVLAAVGAQDCTLRVGAVRYHLRLNGAALACHAIERDGPRRGEPIVRNGDGNMSAQDAQAAAPQKSAGLQVVIDFDLGRTTIPLAELESWQVGSVIKLQPPGRDDGVEVTLRANGQVIGSGDLVRIDDRIGVRVTRLLSP